MPMCTLSVYIVHVIYIEFNEHLCIITYILAHDDGYKQVNKQIKLFIINF